MIGGPGKTAVIFRKVDQISRLPLLLLRTDNFQTDSQGVVAAVAAGNTLIRVRPWVRRQEVAEVDNTGVESLLQWDVDSRLQWDNLLQWDNRQAGHRLWAEDNLLWVEDNLLLWAEDNLLLWADHRVINNLLWEGKEEADSPRRRPHPDVPREIHPDIPPQEIPHPDIPNREIPHPEVPVDIPQEVPPQDIPPQDVPQEVPQKIPRREALLIARVQIEAQEAQEVQAK